MKIKELSMMAELMKETGLTLLEVTEGESIIRMERGSKVVTSPSYDAESMVVNTAANAASNNTTSTIAASNNTATSRNNGNDAAGNLLLESNNEAKSEIKKNQSTITSPMVGVFYASPSPDKAPFVSVGDTVRKGDVLCIIEAMKIMNEINSDREGIIAEICVGDRQVVDYGHPMFRIECP